MPKKDGGIQWIDDVSERLYKFIRKTINNFLKGAKNDVLNRLQEDPEIDRKLEELREKHREVIETIEDLAENPEKYDVDMDE